MSMAATYDDVSEALLTEIAGRRNEGVEGAAPFARVGGRLEVFCSVDLEGRRVTGAAAMASFFRGYEALLVKRGLREAGLVSSTASGICGGVHATASSQCLEMALDIRPPPLGVVARNLLLSCQYLDENPLQLFVFSGPDYSRDTIRRTNPEIWALAETTPATHAATHGFATVGALLAALDRPTGSLFREALTMVRVAREAYAVIGGKYPHSESIVPGGVALALTEQKLDDFFGKLRPFIDYSKRCIAIWDEIFDFLLAANPAYRHLGESPATMIDFGQWDNEDVYDATYARCDTWGEARWSTPGAIVDGTLVTTRLTELNAGLEEQVERSFYDLTEGPAFASDPLGNPISPNHPWNRRFSANPGKEGAPAPYSWATTMTWRGRTFEVGAYARIYLSALGNKLPPSRHLSSTGQSLVFHLPGDTLPACDLEWRPPAIWNAFERNRARAYAVAFNYLVMQENYERAKRWMAAGETKLSAPFDIPEDGERFGAGFCGAGRGFLAHWAVVRNGVLANYQIAVPSRINAGPRAPSGELGACERALANTPIVESAFTGPDDFAGIDILRAIQSFDPCMPCTARMVVDGSGQVLERVVTTTGP